jgi:hypothetical protein
VQQLVFPLLKLGSVAVPFVFLFGQPFVLLKAFVDDPFQLSVYTAEFIIRPFFNLFEQGGINPEDKRLSFTQSC